MYAKSICIRFYRRYVPELHRWYYIYKEEKAKGTSTLQERNR